MHQTQCPSWEYKAHPQAATVVALRCEAILHRLRNGNIQIDTALKDMRTFHHEMFVALTPAGCDYYAGHYRGDRHPYLQYHGIELRGPHADPRVGVKPGRVSHEMKNLCLRIIPNAIHSLGVVFAKPDAELSAADKLQALVGVCCRVLVEFLRIHPFVNGNGHVGRLIVWLLLWRFGYWPQGWPLDGHPNYDQLLTNYRDGDRAGLENFVLNAINGTV